MVKIDLYALKYFSAWERNTWRVLSSHISLIRFKLVKVTKAKAIKVWNQKLGFKKNFVVTYLCVELNISIGYQLWSGFDELICGELYQEPRL